MHDKIRQLELDFLHSLRNISNPFLDRLFEIITMFGEETILIGILAFFYFLYDKKIGQVIAYTLFTSLMVNHTLKGLVKYERPFHFDPELDAVRIETATGYSFPSGHTHQAATLYSSIAKNLNVSRKKLLWTMCLVIILLVGFSRLWLAVHYPKDVIVGLIVGLIMTFLCNYLYKRLTQEEGRTFAEVKPANVRKLYISKATQKEQHLMSLLYDYMEYLRNTESLQIDNSISNQFMGDFFERIIDGCVFELFFKEHMVERGINIIDYLYGFIAPIDDNIEKAIAKSFDALYKTNNEVRTRLELFVSRSPEYLKTIIQS